MKITKLTGYAQCDFCKNQASQYVNNGEHNLICICEECLIKLITKLIQSLDK